MEPNRDRDRLIRLRECAVYSDLLARVLRDALCAADVGPHRDRLRWWSHFADDAAEDLQRLETETWQ